MKLNVENARKWVAELRSGKYKQGRDAMLREGRYCCLGVAHECLIGPVPEDAENCKSGDWTQGAYPCVDRVLGLELGGRDVFVGMNDDEGKTFDEIAAYVEGLIETTVLEEG